MRHNNKNSKKKDMQIDVCVPENQVYFLFNSYILPKSLGTTLIIRKIDLACTLGDYIRQALIDIRLIDATLVGFFSYDLLLIQK